MYYPINCWTILLNHLMEQNMADSILILIMGTILAGPLNLSMLLISILFYHTDLFHLLLQYAIGIGLLLSKEN